MQVSPAGGSPQTAEPARRAAHAATFEFLAHLSNATSAISAVTAPGDLEQTLRDKVRADDDHDQRVAAEVVPTGSADVTNAAEREAEVGSRAWRRAEAGAQGAEQFRDARHGRHSAQVEAGRATPTRQSEQAAGATRDRGASGGRQQQSDSRPQTQSGANAAREPALPQQHAAAPRPASPTAQPAAEQQSASVRAAPHAQVPSLLTPPPQPAASGARTPAQTAQVTATAMSGSASAARGAAAAARPAAAPTNPLVAARGVERNQPTARAAATAAATRAETTERKGPAEQVVRVLRSQLHGENARIVMRLNPAELGELRIEMQMRGDRVSLQIDTQTDVAHRLLRQDEHTLRQSLEAAGVHVEHMEVRPPAAASENASAGLQQQTDPHHAEQDGSARQDAERPDTSGTESPPNVEARERALDELPPEHATESRVNVLA